MREKTLITEANKHSEIIKKVLLEKAAGRRIRKKEIILEWKLPLNQAYFIFELLSKEGFKVEYKYITVPKIPIQKTNPLAVSLA